MIAEKLFVSKLDVFFFGKEKVYMREWESVSLNHFSINTTDAIEKKKYIVQVFIYI